MMAPLLYALVYVSEATRPMSEDDLDTLLRDARYYNEAVGVTGFLAYERPDTLDAPGTFVQYIEGTSEAVYAVFLERIQTSSLHHRIVVKREGPIKERSFPTWSMAYERMRQDTLEGFSDLINKLGPPPSRPT